MGACRGSIRLSGDQPDHLLPYPTSITPRGFVFTRRELTLLVDATALLAYETNQAPHATTADTTEVAALRTKLLEVLCPPVRSAT